MCGAKSARFKNRRFRGVPPLESQYRGSHSLRRTLQGWHLLRGAQSAVLARTILMPVNEDERQAQHQKDGQGRSKCEPAPIHAPAIIDPMRRIVQLTKPLTGQFVT